MDSINDIDLPETDPVPETEAAPQAAAAPVAKEKKPRKSKKKSVLTIVLLLVFFLVIAPVGTYFGTYLMAIKNAKDGNFETADKLLLLKPLTDKHDNVLLRYIAQLLLFLIQYKDRFIIILIILPLQDQMLPIKTSSSTLLSFK